MNKNKLKSIFTQDPSNLRLPLGITGFSSPQLPLLWEAYRKDILTTIYSLGAKVVAEYPCTNEVTPNFHSIETTELLVLAHDTFPLIACSERKPDYVCELKFVDWPTFREAINQTESMLFLTPDVLNTRLTKSILADLSDSEIEEFNYWQSETVGEIIFNWWD